MPAASGSELSRAARKLRFQIGERAARVQPWITEAHHVFEAHVMEAGHEHVGERGLVLEIEQAAHLEVSTGAAREHHQRVVLAVGISLAELVPVYDQGVVPERATGAI